MVSIRNMQIILKFWNETIYQEKVNKYSMGMKQKLSIAVSLMNKPKYLILDEPTNVWIQMVR